MTVLAVFAIGKGAEMETLGRIEQMGVKNIFVRSDNLTQAQKNRALKYHSLGLQLSDIDRLKIACPAIKQTAATRVRVVDLISFPENISPQVLETSSGYSRILGLSMNSGRFISNRDIVNQNRVCALGWSVSKALGAEGKPGQIIHIGGDLWKIVGVIQKQDILGSENTRISLQNVNDLIIIPLGTVVQTKNDGFRPLSELIIEIDSVDKMHLSTAVIKRTLEVAHHGVDDFETIVPFELLAQSRKIQQTFNIVFWFNWWFFSDHWGHWYNEYYAGRCFRTGERDRFEKSSRSSAISYNFTIPYGISNINNDRWSNWSGRWCSALGGDFTDCWLANLLFTGNSSDSSYLSCDNGRPCRALPGNKGIKDGSSFCTRLWGLRGRLV